MSEDVATVAYGIDIGTYFLGTKGRVLSGSAFAWARNDGNNGLTFIEGTYRTVTTIQGSNDIRQLVTHLKRDIQEGRKLAIGIEAPMWQPSPLTIPQNKFSLFTVRFDAEKRHGNVGYEWYQNSGAGALARALSTGRLVLSSLGSALDGLTFSTHDRSVDIFLYEGFAAGRWKILTEGSSHVADAFTTATAFHIARNQEGKSLTMLHKEGSAKGDVLSHWQTILNSIGLDGSNCDKDCLVVGFDSECEKTKQYFCSQYDQLTEGC
jgi:hypothetical protein